MSDPVSLASLFDAAEQAAVGGDFAAAARLLADAARAQEAALGPDHLDLANTLNNLAVAHERSGQLDAAEREFRRAHAIAAQALPANDPLVTTSAENLRDFCEANGRPLDGPALRLGEDNGAGVDAARTIALAQPHQTDVPTAPIERLAITFATEPPPRPAAPEPVASQSTAAPATAKPAPSPAEPVSSAARPTPSIAKPAAPVAKPAPSTAKPAPSAAKPAPAVAAKPAAAGARGPVAATPTIAAPPAGTTTRPASAATPVPRPSDAAPARRVSIPVLVALGAVAALVIWLLAGRGPAAPPAKPQATATDTPAAPSAAAPAVAAPSATPTPALSSSRPTARATAPAPPTPSAASSATPAGADGLTVGDAQLCASLSSSYRCDAAGATVRPGRLAFYNRLVATSDTSVVHRWYRGDELRQSVRLQVPARRQGFRTFSRATVSASDGEWRVELRARDGRLLHAERFSVR
ncbi:MAG: DUF2914 domain-containing protein [Vicinamibacteraceae bacterium]